MIADGQRRAEIFREVAVTLGLGEGGRAGGAED